MLLQSLRAAVWLAAPCCAWAQTAAPPPPPPPTDGASPSQSITIRGHYDNAVGTSDAASQGSIRRELLESRPALRPGEVLEFVPGLIVTQHSGDGKANQYFLRGFNLDHGTDFATRVNGMPVNMPSHGHGQGYTDLNFLMPELVQRIEYRKGPYFAGSGDFSAAGGADIHYVTRLDGPLAQITLGEGRYRRAVLAGSTALQNDWQLLAALELQRTDGPWVVPQDLVRNNLVVRLSSGTAARGLSLTAMSYRAHWTATDQVPQRLIDGGSFAGRAFSRFDSVDPSTGGETSRDSLSAEWHADLSNGRQRLSAYLMRYRLDLNSNFTYSLERPADGDQFKQRDGRTVFGLDASRTLSHRLWGLDARSEWGASLRRDHIDVGLYDSVQRRITAVTREDRIQQSLWGVYGQTSLVLAERLRAIAGLRADHIDNRVDALSLPANGGRTTATQWSPKFSLVAGPFAKTEIFFNAGRGLHSNDARGTTTTLDPKTGDPVDRVPPFAAARGFEIGARTEAIAGLQSSLSLWRLDSASELVYVGDAGATEASAASRRRGVEWSNRWTPTRHVLVDADLAWSHARYRNGDRIPNAVDRVASVATTLRDIGPLSASLQWRYLGPGALIEDNSVRSRSSLTTNLRLGWRFSSRVEALLDIFNLGNRRVDDIQYFYESQLPGEAAPVADRHVHPAEPRSLRLTLKVGFS